MSVPASAVPASAGGVCPHSAGGVGWWCLSPHRRPRIGGGWWCLSPHRRPVVSAAGGVCPHFGGWWCLSPLWPARLVVSVPRSAAGGVRRLAVSVPTSVPTSAAGGVCPHIGGWWCPRLVVSVPTRLVVSVPTLAAGGVCPHFGVRPRIGGRWCLSPLRRTVVSVPASAGGVCPHFGGWRCLSPHRRSPHRRPVVSVPASVRISPRISGWWCLSPHRPSPHIVPHRPQIGGCGVCPHSGGPRIGGWSCPSPHPSPSRYPSPHPRFLRDDVLHKVYHEDAARIVPCVEESLRGTLSELDTATSPRLLLINPAVCYFYGLAFMVENSV